MKGYWARRSANHCPLKSPWVEPVVLGRRPQYILISPAKALSATLTRPNPERSTQRNKRVIHNYEGNRYKWA